MMEIDIKYFKLDMEHFIRYLIRYLEYEYDSFFSGKIPEEMYIYYTSPMRMQRQHEETWADIDTNLTLKFYAYGECIEMFKTNFNSQVSRKFELIQPGWKKVVLFKLGIMYLNSGFVIDPNIVPMKAPEYLLDGDITTYLSISRNNMVNLMMMANISARKSMLFLALFIGYLLNPAEFDLFGALSYTLGTLRIKENERYHLDDVKIAVNVGTSQKSSKQVDLIWFPDEEFYDIKCQLQSSNTDFTFKICDNKLFITNRTGEGWDSNLIVDISLYTNETLYILQETTQSGRTEIMKDDEVIFYREA